ncbi:hypothetical protein MKY64_30265 [Paenibacillus sp. FSL R7-0210]|uniref:hypothetical protein n=1 Tax=Paenibacillus sp. FSL R7-0210 TaxID=2921676 RepID=UPI0030F670FD
MQADEYIEYLRTQAYWISRMADQLSCGEPVDCEWAIEFEMKSPEVIEERELKETA